jgi:hypothetical protein
MARKKTSTSPSTLPTPPTDISLSDNKKPKTVHEFPSKHFPFTKLPADVRQRIWRTYLKSPQDVEVNFRLKDWWSPRCRPEEKIPEFTAVTPQPTILYICHESRVEGLKFLKPCFKADLGMPMKAEREAGEDTDEEQDWTPEGRSSRSRPIKATESQSTKVEKPLDRIYINPEIDTLYVYFESWCWPYIQAIQDSMCKSDDDDDGKSMKDFARTWNKRRVESIMVYWEKGDIFHGTCHSMMVMRQQNRGRPGQPANTGFIKVIQEFCRARKDVGHGFLGGELDEIKTLGRWDTGWEGMIQHLINQDCSHLWR